MNKKNKTASFKKQILLFWKLFLGLILGIVLIFLFTAWGVFGSLPDETVLENPEINLATEIFTADGKTLGKIYKDNRTPVQYEDLPQNLINALISTEDERFYSHSGIDARGTARAFIYLGKKGGASTITQQLAKLLFTENVGRNILSRSTQKIKEWIIAIRLERRYTKEEIITMYLNEFDFLFEADGIRSASRIYFNKEPIDLNIEESATLVAMLKNPRQYNPKRSISQQKSLQRRNQVLYQMYRNEFIPEAVKDSLQQLPIVLDFTPEGHNDGIGTYFREYTRNFLQDWIKDHPKPDGSAYNIYRDGLKIYTTIDSRLQQFAEEAVALHMPNLQKVFNDQNKKNKSAPFRSLSEKEVENSVMLPAMKRSERWRIMKNNGVSEEDILKSFETPTEMNIFSWNGDIDTIMTPRDSIRYYKSFLRAGMMSLDPINGHVKVWVGGINHKHFKYDMVQKGRRQVGSTFKPFLYATAIEQLHLSPCDTLPNVQHTLEKGRWGIIEDWTPKNSDGKYGGMTSLKAALANSLNTISARLMDRVGPQSVLDLVKRMDINTEDIPVQPAIALGALDLSVYEMISGYSTFANQGQHVEPILITRIEDKNGSLLYQNTPNIKDVMSEEAAYVTVNLLEGVTQYGSGQRLRHTWAGNTKIYKEVVTGYPYGFTNPIAGKTGTTQNQSDGWFIGMVPNLVTGVWVGGEDRSVRFNSLAYGQGASMALPIWGIFMKKAYSVPEIGISKDEFIAPENLSIEIDCENYGKPKEAGNWPSELEELEL
ncbi:MAG: transglycosylase domain-containing protein [Flavobacteriaceae bacterium]|nr:transglycosylase domain-containing protein [Flavobacteriaceae bacterium]